MDAVINHMCGYGSGTGHGSAGSWYNSEQMQFPGVPYGPNDFNCCWCGGTSSCASSSCDIENYSDKYQVQRNIPTNSNYCVLVLFQGCICQIFTGGVRVSTGD